ncbi:hypothetical protein V1525DRAFT_395320 [Lipomyces kononenkoae]|uniref:Uncharacterized protein n=1 Tax=Lipomyces kononenkoae TaxID=34357 RepID=A0ACC3TA77_LIPKO
MAPVQPAQQTLKRFFAGPAGSRPKRQAKLMTSNDNQTKSTRPETTRAETDSEGMGICEDEVSSTPDSVGKGDSLDVTSSPRQKDIDVTPPSSPVSRKVTSQQDMKKRRKRRRSRGQSGSESESGGIPKKNREDNGSSAESKALPEQNNYEAEVEVKGARPINVEASSSAETLEVEASDGEPLLSEDEIKEELPLVKKELSKKSKWALGSHVPYAALCATFEKIEATTKRLEIISYCSAFFQEVLSLTPDSLLQVVYLFINRLSPDYEGIEIGLGESILMKAIGECTGRSQGQIKADYQKTGDLGTVAQNSRMNQPTMFKPKPLTVESVFKNLKEIAMITGSQSQSRKVGIITKMLSACQGNEAKYLVRSLEGKLRIHLAEKTVLTSLAQAVVAWEAQKNGKAPSPTNVIKAEEVLRAVYYEMPSYDLIIPAIVKDGIMNLRQTCALTPGVPLKPMLAKPTKSITEVLDRFQEQKFTCEYKYDGERVQIHFQENGKSHVYSRNSEDMSAKYPDIVSAIERFIKPETKSFVLDCEAVAWDRDAKKILPFQVLSTRKRKDVQEGDIKVRVCLFAFDMLYANGRSLLQTPLSERRKLLHESFNEVEGEFAFATYKDGINLDEIQEFLDQSVKDSCEGLMIKMLEGEESGYEPSKRSRNWLKLKKDYLTGVGDSLDLVVIGAFYGRGKRTNWYGAFLLACYNQDSQEYETICKIGTGFSEEMLGTLYQKLSQTTALQPRSYYSYTQSNANAPDVWFEPTMVWEVIAADLSLSPVYRAAISEIGRNKGVSLRFPRFIRIRDDKSPEQATTSEQVCELYHSQASAAANGGEDVGEDEY